MSLWVGIYRQQPTDTADQQYSGGVWACSFLGCTSQTVYKSASSVGNTTGLFIKTFLIINVNFANMGMKRRPL